MNEWNEYEWISEELPKVLRFPKTPDARRESRLGDIDDIMDAEPEMRFLDVDDVSFALRCRFYDVSTFLDRVGDLAWPWRRHFARSGRKTWSVPRGFFSIMRFKEIPYLTGNAFCLQLISTFIRQLCHAYIHLKSFQKLNTLPSALPPANYNDANKTQTCTGCTLEIKQTTSNNGSWSATSLWKQLWRNWKFRISISTNGAFAMVVKCCEYP